MRLTLRTLLAYLDEILDPHDAEQLRRKIADSEFATNLVHQIRGSVRRRGLDAPALNAEGMGGDANSIAEYLDNTLPPDQVPHLEKACLESEVSLGEVASCHQVLTLVLGQAAEVTEAMRATSYAIAAKQPGPVGATHVEGDPSPSSHERKDQRSGAKAAIVPPPASPASPRETSPPRAPAYPSTKEAWRAEAQDVEIAGASVVAVPTPDYRRASSNGNGARRLRMVGIMVLVAVLILAGLFVAASSLDPTLRDWWRLSDSTFVADSLPNDDPALESEPATNSTAGVVDEPIPPTERVEVPWQGEAPRTSELDVPQPQIGFPTTEEAPLSVPDPVTDPLGLDNLQFEDDEYVRGSEVSPTNEEIAGPTPTDIPDFPDASATDTVQAEIVTDATPQPTDVGERTSPSMPQPHVETAEPEIAELSIRKAEPPSVPPLLDRTVDEPTMWTESPVQPPVAAPLDSSEPRKDSPLDIPEPTAPEPMSSKVLPLVRASGDQLLLVKQAENASWRRVQPASELLPGSDLLSLPAFRTDVEIGDSVTCTMVGATRLSLGPEANITLHSGQFLLRLAPEMHSQGIRHRGEVFDVWTNEADGVVAIEASREFLPGADPLRDIPHTVLRVYANKNDATVRYRGKTYDLPQGHQLLRLDNFPPRIEAETDKPKWMKISAMTRVDANAVRLWKKDLANVENVRFWLQERAATNRYNERALASRCLAEMDQFDRILAALNDPDQRAFWAPQYETLRRALTRGPQVVQQLSFELEKIHGEGADDMFQMLLGYGPRQLANGAAERLVANLSHQSLDRRVLAILNLQQITGLTHQYRAEESVGRRRSAVNAWRGRLRNGKVKYQEAPELSSLIQSFTPATEG